jgi:transposase
MGVKVRRSLIILASAQKMKVPEIVRLYQLSGEHVRQLIHRLNKEGADAISPRFGGRRPRTFTPEQRADILERAQIRPKVLGMPFTQWSLSKLKEVAEKKKILRSNSMETVRCILDEANITYQHTKTWKESNDPGFQAKKRIEHLYKNPQKDGRVICVDEFGPLSIRPYAGKGWFSQKKPVRFPATYTRKHGVRH